MLSSTLDGQTLPPVGPVPVTILRTGGAIRLDIWFCSPRSDCSSQSLGLGVFQLNDILCNTLCKQLQSRLPGSIQVPVTIQVVRCHSQETGGASWIEQLLLLQNSSILMKSVKIYLLAEFYKNVAKVSLWALNQSSGVMRRGNNRFSILKKPKITFIMLINPSTFIWPYQVFYFKKSLKLHLSWSPFYLYLAFDADCVSQKSSFFAGFHFSVSPWSSLSLSAPNLFWSRWLICLKCSWFAPLHEPINDNWQ